MAEISENIPEHCPGIESDAAGKSAACVGCPNKQICDAGKAKAPDPAIDEIKQRLNGVKHKIVILSGKGGVGKSTFTSHLAHGIADDDNKQGKFTVILEQLQYSGMGRSFHVQVGKAGGDEQLSDFYTHHNYMRELLSTRENIRGLVFEVGVLDVDICGPSIPKVMGLEGEQVHQSGSGWSPIYVEDNLGVMSVGFLLSGPDDAVVWRGPKKNGMIKQFLRDVDWGELDYLIIDTPPGTSDEHLSVVQYLKAAGIDGTIIITTPQEVALLDVRKEITFCRKVQLNILGVVENMSGFICPKCKNSTDIFPATTGGAEKMCEEMDVNFLGRLPLDPRIGKCCDDGKSFLKEVPDSPATQAFRSIIKKIEDRCSSSISKQVEKETGEST